MFQIFCAHGGIPRPVTASVPQSALASYAHSCRSVHPFADVAAVAGYQEATPPAVPQAPTPSPGGIATKSPRSKRITTPQTSAKAYVTPDLRLLALSRVPKTITLAAIPPKAVSSPPPASSTPGTPLSSASSVSVTSPFSSHTITPAAGLDILADCLSEDDVTRAAMDVLWADPASQLMETTGKLDSSGFGPGIRGGDTFCFGDAAIEAFLQAYGFQYVLRAHQATAAGVEVTTSTKCVTVFSTSKDHGCGSDATCGCLMIENGMIYPIVRSRCYDMTVTPSAHLCSSERKSPAQVSTPVQHRSDDACSPARVGTPAFVLQDCVAASTVLV
jgi:hypothetical protein